MPCVVISSEYRARPEVCWQDDGTWPSAALLSLYRGHGGSIGKFAVLFYAISESS